MRLSRRSVTKLATALLMMCLTAQAVPGRAADRPEPGVVRRAAEAVCDYNKALMEEACEVFRIKQGRYPTDPEELRDLFARQPRCPADGDLTLAADGLATCSTHDRVGPALLTLQVFPAQSSGVPSPTPRSVFRRGQASAVVFLARWQDDGLTHLVEVDWINPAGKVIKTEQPSWQRKSVAESRFPLATGSRTASPLTTGIYRVRLRLDNRPAGSCTFRLL